MSEATKTCNRCGNGYELYESLALPGHFKDREGPDHAPQENYAKRTGSVTLFVDNPIDPAAKIELCPPCAMSFAEWRTAETATAKPKRGRRSDG